MGYLIGRGRKLSIQIETIAGRSLLTLHLLNASISEEMGNKILTGERPIHLLNNIYLLTGLWHVICNSSGLMLCP